MRNKQNTRVDLRLFAALGIAVAAVACTKSVGPVPPKEMPRWLLDKLLNKHATLAGRCEYENGYTAVEIARDRKTADAQCARQCATVLAISPASPSVRINKPITLNFRTQTVLGGTNTICQSSGSVDWGDGSPQTHMPADPWTACDKVRREIVHNSNGNPIDVTLTHSFPTAGMYCVSAQVWGNHKYDGNGSCSYDCYVYANTYVTVNP